MVCVQGIWTFRIIGMAYYSHAGCHSSCGGYASPSGRMGISEKLFMEMFLPIFGSTLLLPGMILSRGLGYYTELMISAIFTVVASFVIGRRSE